MFHNNLVMNYTWYFVTFTKILSHLPRSCHIYQDFVIKYVIYLVEDNYVLYTRQNVQLMLNNKVGWTTQW